ncbi:DUF294 nucleotidyltransferase-like domain-containing protein [Limibacillus halophilus]|uniref:DNA polymerase-3 subunit epsilon/CBS domain-containing protein n=1 Tax=Limibacillus halophilus TaxID=1579333 RepID=A0A839STZ1_9PROT|nr:DUF294 nucleotidyltransferase-like domain-containing protein [Limibacillus halophilus]MBB3064876.1 DNA polymerase-3 subunit epsilon/CBS domain-containing protein [Limibacillus halophilus]
MPGKLPPAGHTPLVALPVLVLDLETTGLNVKEDRLVQIAGIAMAGARVLPEPQLNQLVNPGVSIPPAATRVHGIDDQQVADASRFSDLYGSIADLISDRVVVGHHIAFDLAILKHEAARIGVAWRDPQQLDVGQLLGALQPALPDLALETVAAFLDVTITRRHDAMGDCEATAQAWSRLLDLLRERDIRTLAEAQAFAAGRDDIQRREVQAGWHTAPGNHMDPGETSGEFRIDSHAFQARLADHMRRPPIMVPGATTLRKAVQRMVECKVGALLIGEPASPPIGIFTERDLLRLLAEGTVDIDDAPVSSVMSAPVETLGAEDMLYRALGRMDRLGIRHICVAGNDGSALGMISQRDLLDHRARGAVMLDDALVTAKDLQGLAAAFARVPEVAGGLLTEDLDGLEIARFVSQELQSLTARAAELAAQAVEAQGLGPAPAPWCVIVLGSGGRGESLLGADQDNALIHEGGEADDPWFAALGERMADLLDAAGVPRCKGGIMVKNALWRGNVADWRGRVDGWLRKASPEDLLNVDIFFDLAPVVGPAEIARAIKNDAIQQASESIGFLTYLADSVSAVAPRFSLFNRLPLEEGRVDLKRDGLLPLVSLARTLGLRAASKSRATPERLRDAVVFGNLAEADAEILLTLQSQLMTAILRQQLSDLAEGIRPSSRVALKDMRRSDKKDLLSGLGHLREIVDDLRNAVSR